MTATKAQSNGWHAFVIVAQTDPMQFVTMVDGLFVIVDDVAQALQFARPVDAERMLEPGWTVHLFRFHVLPGGEIKKQAGGRI